jgi:hypothetical protein
MCSTKATQSQVHAGCISEGREVENIKRLKKLILKHDE